MFSSFLVRSVLPHCNTRLRLLHLLYDIDFFLPIVRQNATSRMFPSFSDGIDRKVVLDLCNATSKITLKITDVFFLNGEK